MLAAAHPADLAAAREAGLATAFIARPLEHGPQSAGGETAAGGWDLAGESITEIAGFLSPG
jgi:2-haloacid dehalogenase